MTLTNADRSFLATLAPIDPDAMSSRDFDRLVDGWYANDHYSDNPAYTVADEVDSHA
jgi:hypothetical protein